MGNNINNNFKAKGTYIGAFSVLLGALFFSGKAILVKMIYAEEPSVNHVTLLALRMGFSLPFFLGIALYKQGKYAQAKPILRKDWFNILLLGIGGYYMSSVFDFWGLEYVTASLERLILFIYPTLVVLISAVFFKKKITKVVIVALALAYTGICLVMVGEHMADRPNIVTGSVLIFLAAITYASYLVGSEQMIYRLGNVRYTSIVMTIACSCVIIHFVLVNHISDLNISLSVLLKSMGMAFFCTVIPSFLISEGIKKIGAPNAAIIASVGPVSTIFLAQYFLKEQIEGIQILGTLTVVAGVILTSIYGKRMPTQS